jgi:uncharacterized phage protein gp47/JayE
MSIPTTRQAIDSAVATIESNIGQTIPLYDKNFLHVLGVVVGMNNAELYRYGVQRVKQVLALTASGDDLTHLGLEYAVRRKPPYRAIINVLVIVPLGLSGVIRPTDVMRCEANGMYYFPIQEYPWTPADGGDVYIKVRAEFPGPEGNLEPSTRLNFNTTPENGTGFGFSTLDPIDLNGSDEETDDELRIRILDEIQTVGGGSNLADYRTWGQRTPNVLRVEPYSGSVPWEDSLPGERTVFVESVSSYDPDGLADASLLAAVEQYINYDQDTGKRNPCLGSTDDTLTITSITRYSLYITIYGMTLDDVARTLACQQDVTSTLENLIYGVHPYLMGLDTEAFRNDVVTPSLIARHAQRVVQAYGGSLSRAEMSLSYGGVVLDSLTLDPGWRLKAVVNYV